MSWYCIPVLRKFPLSTWNSRLQRASGVADKTFLSLQCSDLSTIINKSFPFSRTFQHFSLTLMCWKFYKDLILGMGHSSSSKHNGLFQSEVAYSLQKILFYWNLHNFLPYIFNFYLFETTVNWLLDFSGIIFYVDFSFSSFISQCCFIICKI